MQDARVFCIGEVFEYSPATAAKWRGPLDSILNFPLRRGILDAFITPGPQNISALATAIKANWDSFSDVGLLGKLLSWRTKMFCVGETSQWTPKVFSLCCQFCSDAPPEVPQMHQGMHQILHLHGNGQRCVLTINPHIIQGSVATLLKCMASIEGPTRHVRLIMEVSGPVLILRAFDWNALVVGIECS